MLQLPVVSAVDRFALVYDRWKKTEPIEKGNKRGEGRPRSRRMRERRKRRREVMMEEEESYKGERE